MKPNEGIDLVSNLIDEKLSNLTPPSPECCIFKVHHPLRQVNEKAYEPQMLSIGPYHRRKDCVQVMEDHKLRYLQQLLERKNESSVKRYIMTLRGLEERARNCYAGSVGLSVDEFVEMMLLDGCFIIELFYKLTVVEPTDRNDPILNSKWLFSYLVRDLMLFENQLPFFVLSQLFKMTKDPNVQYNFTDVALYFFGHWLPPLRGISYLDENEIKHLLGLFHNAKIPSFARIMDPIYVRDNKENWRYIHCATELQEAGVKFKKSERGSWFDIKFTNGVMEISTMLIDDCTESFFRNLIAYEQYCQGNDLNYFTDYVTFMDCLVNSSKDVKLLRGKGIFEIALGDDEVVSTMFNKIRNDVIIFKSNFCYAEIFINVNKYSSKRRNVWMAKLWRNYFNCPWALVSFIAAVLLLLLTSVQTIFSILSYFQ